MSSWAALEVPKLTMGYLLSPAYYCSNIFWAALGYGTSSQTLITTIHRQSILIASAPPSPPSGVASRPDPRPSSTSTVDPQLLSASEEDFVLVQHEPSSPVASANSVLAESTFEHHGAEESIDSATSRGSTTSSSSSSSPPPTPSSQTTLDLDPDAMTFDATIRNPGAIATRPLSSLLSVFSFRATACLSTFESLEEGTEPWDVVEVGSHLREPTKAEEQFVQRAMAKEVREVEAIIEKVVDETRIDSMLHVPGGHSYFETMVPSFVDVPVSDEGIDTERFLKAVEALLLLFEQFASTAFALVQGDIVENIRRIRVRALAFPLESKTLERIVVHESHDRRRLATEALMWLIRGLKFTAMSIRGNLDSTNEEELSESFNTAWVAEYSKYFNFLVRPLFKLLVRAAPGRQVFYEALGSPRERVVVDLDRWLSALEGQVGRLEKFYAEGKYAKGL